MSSFWRIFSLEFLSFTRTRTLALLLTASVGWMLLVPVFLHGDGTADGLRELTIRYSLGGVFAILSISLLASATGSLARERVARRLQLTLVRPVRYTVIILAKILAHVSIAAMVLALACIVLLCQLGASRPCAHVYKPVLPSLTTEAEGLYEQYLADESQAPQFREWLRKTPKKDVVRLLETKVADMPMMIPTNRVVTWNFDVPREIPESSRIRMRFSNQFNLRDFAVGKFELGECRGTVSNLTRSVMTTDLSAGRSARELRFTNLGKHDLMLRPRRDLDVLLPADAFAMNLLRSFLAMLAILSLLTAFGICLSAALGRPVALFAAFAVMFISTISPDTLDSYGGEAEAPFLDRVGLSLARIVSDAVKPVASVDPLEKLADDDCVEWNSVGNALLKYAVVWPLGFAFLAGYILPRKREDDFA